MTTEVENGYRQEEMTDGLLWKSWEEFIPLAFQVFMLFFILVLVIVRTSTMYAGLRIRMQETIPDQF